MVRNIPADKRCVPTAAYSGSLVGVTLEVHLASLHKPEYVRILLGCVDVERIPPAEGCLGDDFYDFYYEVDKVVVGPSLSDKRPMSVGSDKSSPSSKRARTGEYGHNGSGPSMQCTEHSAEFSGNGGGNQTVQNAMPPTSDKVYESDSSYDGELLIETIAREQGGCVEILKKDSSELEVQFCRLQKIVPPIPGNVTSSYSKNA